MSNDYFNVTGDPAPGSTGFSAPIRALFTSVAAAFGLLPALSGNAGKVVTVSSGATSLTPTNALTISGNNATVAGSMTVRDAVTALGGTRVSTDGTAQVQALGVSTSGTQIVLSAGAHKLVAGSVSAGGSGYTIGDVLYDPASGSKFTITIAFGVITAVATSVAGFLPASNDPPATVALVGGTGSGCIINVTWTTMAYLGVGSLTNAANDAAAAAAGVPVDAWYRNGSVMMQRQS